MRGETSRRVLVTGASGFLGRHVLARLQQASGLSVIPVSRSATRQGWVSVHDYRNCPEADVLIHLAEEPDRAKVNSEGEAYAEHTAETVRALLSKARIGLIYVSSGVVYGDQGTKPFAVTASTLGIDTYSQSKLANEKWVLDAGGCVVRLSNLIGRGMSPNNVLSDILAQLPGTGPLRVRDDGPIRDYLGVDDAANAIAMLAGEIRSGIVNVGSGVGTSVRQLAGMALAMAGQSEREIVATSPRNAHSYNVLDIAASISTMGWRPSSTLQEELAQLVRSNVRSIDE